MTEAAKEARRAYKREWNRANRDRVRASQERYWERKAAAEKLKAETVPADQDTPAEAQPDEELAIFNDIDR